MLSPWLLLPVVVAAVRQLPTPAAAGPDVVTVDLDDTIKVNSRLMNGAH
eukprot:SAG31_NODE_35830_length_319_cov_0.940909_1_plen_48_part_01